MGIVKLNKGQLSAFASELKTNTDKVSTEVSDLSSNLSSVKAHDKFPALKSKCSLISDSVDNIDLDFKHLSGNITKYIETLSKIDAEGFDVSTATKETSGNRSSASSSSSRSSYSTSGYSSSGGSRVVNNYYYGSSGATSSNSSYSYTAGPNGMVVHTGTNSSTNTLFPSSSLTSKDYNVPAGGNYNYEGIEKYLENEKGITVEVPAGLGNVHTYMGWQMITAKSSKQYKLREAAGMKFDDEGFAKIGDRYVIACTTTFGNVGDFIDVYMEDGTVLKCVIGDIKSQGDPGCNKWGHNNGDCIIEFVVDKDTWYNNGRGGHPNPGTESCHPEWNQEIDKIVNKGNFFDLIKKDAAQFTEEDLKVAEEAGLLDGKVDSDVSTDDSASPTTDKVDVSDDAEISEEATEKEENEEVEEEV